MKTLKQLSLPLLLVICFMTVKGQLVSVNPSSGAASVQIPLHTVTRGQISVPISLVYNGSGVRAKDVEGTAGIGWNLMAGGSISRDLRDLPDDLATNSAGWLYNSNAALMGFTIQNDNNTSTCTDETADINYISTYLSGNTDLEPDVFNLSLPGLSCKIIFDGLHQPRTLPQTDLQISYTTNPSGIATFRVKDDKGMIYDFNQAELASRTAKASNPSAIQFNKNVYEKYKNGVSYVRRWHLTKITDPSGNAVNFEYLFINNAVKYSKTPYSFYLGNTSTLTPQYEFEEWGFHLVLRTIDWPIGDVWTPGAPKIKFDYRSSSNTHVAYLYEMSGDGVHWLCSYYDVGPDPHRAITAANFLRV